MNSRFGDHIRPKSEEDLKVLNNLGFTLNRTGLKWFFFEMRGVQKYYIRMSRSLPENDKWSGGIWISFAHLKRK